jgi:hypothetical protein
MHMLAKKAFAQVVKVQAESVSVEPINNETQTYRCRHLGSDGTIFEGTFTFYGVITDSGVVCVTTKYANGVWEYPHSWHHLPDISSVESVEF